MLGLKLEETRIYQEAKEEGKLAAVPLLLKAGVSVEKIAEELGSGQCEVFFLMGGRG